MSLLNPAPMTRTEWRDDFDTMQNRLIPFMRTSPSGEHYVDPDFTPGLLLKAHYSLVEIGLQHGWLGLDDDGQPADENGHLA